MILMQVNGVPNWLNLTFNLATTLGGIAIGVWGFNTALRAYLDWRLTLAEKHNTHSKTVIGLIEQHELKYQQLKTEIEELEAWFKEENKDMAQKCRDIQTHSMEFRKDSLEMIKIALKLK